MANAKELPVSRNNGNITQSYKASEDLNDIRSDLETLKTDIVRLTQHVGESGVQTAYSAADLLRRKANSAKKFGKAEMVKAEKHIKERPVRSVALAFAAGLVFSLLLRRS